MADSEEYPGPYCMKNGISTDWLISLLSNSKDGPDQPNVPDFNDPTRSRCQYQMTLKMKHALCVLEDVKTSLTSKTVCITFALLVSVSGL